MDDAEHADPADVAYGSAADRQDVLRWTHTNKRCRICSMKRAPAVAFSVLALSLAFATGRWSVPTQERTSSSTTDAAERRVVERVTTLVDGSCERELAATKQGLALASEIIDAGMREHTGAPEVFPPDLLPQYTADGFEAAVLGAMEDCPDISVALVHVECSEFPCMAFFSQPLGTYNHALGALLSCAAWRNSFDSSGSANASFMTEGGPVEYSMAAPRPTGFDFDDNAQIRWKYRYDQGRAFLMDEWGGVDPTELDEVEQQLEFWHNVAEGDPERAESIGTILADLEAKRTRLITEDAGNGE